MWLFIWALGLASQVGMTVILRPHPADGVPK